MDITWTVLIFLTIIGIVFGHISTNLTRTNPVNKNDAILKRNKRFILFNGGGVSKSVLGLVVPVETKDKVNWRTLNMGYNFQAQYVPLPSIIYPWTRFERSLVRQKRQFDKDGSYIQDGTREFVYTAYELIMNRKGSNGKQCLLRAICEAAQTPISHVGVFDEVLQLFLTPNESEIHNDYVDAMHAGKHGVDCLSLYYHCPQGHGLLDGISYFSS